MNEVEHRTKWHPNQWAIREACFKYRDVDVRGGRKFGKTWSLVHILRDWTIEYKAGLYVVAAPTNKYLKDQVVPELQVAFPPELLVGGKWSEAYNITDQRLRVKTTLGKSVILLRSMERESADGVRPLSPVAIICDEFSYWPRYSWAYCVSPTVMAKQAKTVKAFTPKGMNHAHEEYFREAPDHKVFHYSSYDGPVPKEEIDRLAATMAEGVKCQEIYAEFLEDLGGVFQGVRECIAGDKEGSIRGEQYVIGADVAATQDFNVATVVKRSSRAVVEQIRFTGVEPETVAARFKGLSDQYNQAVIWIDETGLGWGVADRVRTMGAPVKPYKFGAETKRQLIANLIMAISGRTIRYPDIPELVNELQIYQAKPLPSGTVQYSAPSGYHDDCVIALGLAVWGLGGGPPAYAPVIKDEGYL